MKNIRIVLIYPSHPGNIGAVARAMKTMGLSRLYLVSPREFPSEEATQRASSAADVLDNAVVVDSFEKAIADCQYIVGSGSEKREHDWPVLTPKTLAERVAQRSSNDEIAIVFGRESIGMSNEELMHCDAQVVIPANPVYSSLNLAAAVQIITYELRQAQKAGIKLGHVMDVKKAAQQKREALYHEVERLAISTGYYDPKRPLRFPVRMRQLIGQLELADKDADMLLGFLKRVSSKKP